MVHRKTHNNGHYVRLLRNERLPIAGYHDWRAAGVESRFTSTNIDATLAHLKERARLVVAKNPWVLGRLKTHRGTTSLWVPDQPNYDTLLREIFVDSKNFDSALADCHVDDGWKILDKDTGVVKLCAVRSKDRNVRDFVLTISVSHVIGETTMIYALWGMLNEGAEITELIQERVHDFRGNPISAMKGAGMRKFLWFLLCSNASPLGLQSRPRISADKVIVSCYEINMKWVKEQKESHDKSTAGAPYLSTQDIITAWFFKQWATACVGVAFDMRNRNKLLTEKHMGNYQEALILYPQEYREPCNIRRAVASQGKWHPPRNKPGKENRRSVGWITGWHGKHVDLELPYAVRKNHFPLRDATGQMPITRSQPWMCLFKTSAKQFAIWTLTSEEIKDKSALGEKIEFY